MERTAVYSPVTLAPGDIVRVSYSGAPEMNQAQKIRADGRISLPMIGEVDAAGKTLVALQSELASRYESQLQDNDVVVALDSAIAPVYVSGAVKRPGKILVDRPMTLLETIMESGGFDEASFANPKKVFVLRNIAGKYRTVRVDLSPALNGKPVNAFYVRPYDVVYVTNSLF